MEEQLELQFYRRVAYWWGSAFYTEKRGQGSHIRDGGMWMDIFPDLYRKGITHVSGSLFQGDRELTLLEAVDYLHTDRWYGNIYDKQYEKTRNILLGK